MYKVSLKEILTVIAIDKADKHFEKVKFLKECENFDIIRNRRIQANLENLQSEILESPDPANLWFNKYEYYKPFRCNEVKQKLPERLVILADVKDTHGKYICFYLHQSKLVSNEDYILSLTAEQRESCYVIYMGMLQGFKVVDGIVVYDDIVLPMETKSNEVNKPLKSKRKKGTLTKDEEIDYLKKRVGQMQGQINDIAEYIESISK